MFCRSLFVFLSFFLLVIVLSVILRFTESDYLPFVSANSFSPLSDIGDHSQIWLFCLNPLVFLLPKLLSYLAVPSFDFEFSWWRLFKTSVVRTELYMFVLPLVVCIFYFSKFAVKNSIRCLSYIGEIMYYQSNNYTQTHATINVPLFMLRSVWLVALNGIPLSHSILLLHLLFNVSMFNSLFFSEVCNNNIIYCIFI